MLVHAQGLSATLDFPPTGVVTGAPTLATGVSPFGQVNHLLDAGRSIRFGKRMRFASTPMIGVTQAGKTQTRLLTNLKREEEDEKGEEPQAYPDSIADEDVSVTLAPPSMISGTRSKAFASRGPRFLRNYRGMRRTCRCRPRWTCLISAIQPMQSAR